MYRHYIIEGKVQGVGYRRFTLEKAKKLKISGWVKNRPTGEVECLAIGEESVLRVFENILKQGSSFSQVTHIRVNPVDETLRQTELSHSTSNFEIQY